MNRQKRQSLTLCLTSKMRDFFGVWEVSVIIGDKSYTYPISSEFKVRKIEQLIRLKKFGSAIKLLNEAKIKGFNAYEKGSE
jgi:hypothetical protein